MTLIAHGVGSRADLPLPVTFVVIGGGLAVVASFAALGVLWKRPVLRGADAGHPVPERLQGFIDSPHTTAALRAVFLALTTLVVAVALGGSPEVPFNLAPWVLYVTFWVGLVPLSLLLGPVWARYNPLRTLHLGLATLTGPGRGAAKLPRLGYYPAAVSLLVFAWLELAAPDRSNPRRVGLFLLAYAVLHLAAASWFGQGWFTRDEGFEVYSRLLGRLAFIGRRSDGRLAWRSPLHGVDSIEPRPGLWAVLTVLVGSTAFDGLTRTRWWQESTFGASGGAVAPLVGLLVTVAVVTALYLAAAGLAGHIAGSPGTLNRYAHSLVPIAAGYATAHYFSLLLLDGQTTWILASDPFHTGLDLFGTAGKSVDYTIVSTRTISLVQVFAIVGAHINGLLLAHDRALVIDEESHRPHRPWQAQLPMLLVMVTLTSGGLALLLGT